MVSSVDWGSVPDWLSGSGTLAAVVFAAVAARAALNTNRQQNEQLRHLNEADERRIASEKRAQASRVASWLALDPDGDIMVSGVNGSGLPIYNATIASRCAGQIIATSYAYLGPTDQPKIMGRATRDLRGAATAVRDGRTWADLRESGELRAATVFLDTEGNWWLRDFEGRLGEHCGGTVDFDQL